MNLAVIFSFSTFMCNAIHPSRFAPMGAPMFHIQHHAATVVALAICSKLLHPTKECGCQNHSVLFISFKIKLFMFILQSNEVDFMQCHSHCLNSHWSITFLRQCLYQVKSTYLFLPFTRWNACGVIYLEPTLHRGLLVAGRCSFYKPGQKYHDEASNVWT